MPPRGSGRPLPRTVLQEAEGPSPIPLSHSCLPRPAADALLLNINIFYTIPLLLAGLTPTATSPKSSTPDSSIADEITQTLSNLSESLTYLQNISTHPELAKVKVPKELIQYVEDGRNPDVYTRQFVEIVVQENQVVKGKAEAFRGFGECLLKEAGEAFPELEAELAKIGEGMKG